MLTQHMKGVAMTQEEIKNELQALSDDPTMITRSIYSPSATDWPDSKFPFVEHHLNHLASHKLTDPQHYLTNLKLMIKKR